MADPTDQELLEEFASSRSESAFRVLVERHLDHVHSVARRVTCNDDLARDVSQQVFIKLAARHGQIPGKVSLAVWLHVNTRSAAIDLVRREEARRRREQTAQQLATMNEPDLADWPVLEPVIDEVIEQLPPMDREIVIMRFYQKRSHGEIGETVGIAPDAARMRVNRALEKLRKHLSKRGIATTAAALSLCLPANAVSPAPAALAPVISSSAVAATGKAIVVVSSKGFTASIFAAAKAHMAAFATVVVVVPVIGLQQAKQIELRLESDRLKATLNAAVAEKQNKKPMRLNLRRPGDLKHIFSQSDPMKRIRALIEYVEQLELHWIGEALEDLRQGAPEWDREAEFIAHMMLTRWGQHDAKTALESLKAGAAGHRASDATSILASLASRDVKEALLWLNDPENALKNLPDLGHYLAGTIAKEWVRQDPNEALSWAQSLSDDQRSGAYSGVLVSLATTDPQRASTLAVELEPGRDRVEVVGEIAHYWARKSADKALEWAQMLGEAEREHATGKALGAWAETAPQNAAHFIDALPAGELADSYVAAVTDTWARQAPAEAAGWLSQQAETTGKVEAMSHLIWNWTTIDPKAASTWLASQPDRPSRDSGIVGLATATISSDPESALTWSNTITNESLRQSQIRTNLATWTRRDPQGARIWASQHGIKRK